MDFAFCRPSTPESSGSSFASGQGGRAPPMRPRLVFFALLATALPALAWSDTPVKPAWWLAASGSEVTFDDRNWGRLSLDDGELSFVSNGYEWRVDVADIARIETVKTRPDTVAIDTASG